MLAFSKKAAVLVVVVLFLSISAWCDSIDFMGSGSGGTWSWNGSDPLSATSLGVSVQIVGSPDEYTISMAHETFTSGPFLGGSGTVSDPWEFGASSPNSFVLTGCVPPQTSCTPVSLFTGQFMAPGEMAVQGSGSMLFTSPSVYGWVDPDLLSFLGLSSNNPYVMGTYQVTLDGPGTGSGLVASGDLVVSPTPELASLVLVGFGLVGLALVTRRFRIES